MYFDVSKLHLPSISVASSKTGTTGAFQHHALFICPKNNHQRQQMQGALTKHSVVYQRAKGEKNKKLHFEETTKGKYERTHDCLTMKTMVVFALHSIENELNLEENHHLQTGDISPENNGGFTTYSLSVSLILFQ